MRNDAIKGRFINRVNCDHEECARIREIRKQAFTERKWFLVNQCETELAKCAEQVKK